jgi:hypothetical protein
MDIRSKIGLPEEKKILSLHYGTFSLVYVLNGTVWVSFDLLLYH